MPIIQLSQRFALSRLIFVRLPLFLIWPLILPQNFHFLLPFQFLQEASLCNLYFFHLWTLLLPRTHHFFSTEGIYPADRKTSPMKHVFCTTCTWNTLLYTAQWSNIIVHVLDQLFNSAFWLHCIVERILLLSVPTIPIKAEQWEGFDAVHCLLTEDVMRGGIYTTLIP